MEAFPLIFKVFPENAKVRFDCAGRERIEVQAPDFLALCLHFCSPFFVSFFEGSWTPFSAFPEKSRKRCKKEPKKGAEIDAFPMIF